MFKSQAASLKRRSSHALANKLSIFQLRQKICRDKKGAKCQTEEKIVGVRKRINLKSVCSFFVLFRGCQMVSFQTKNPTLGIFLQDLGMENVVVHSGHLEYFTTIGYIL
jgi:hypothetical protein